MVVLEPKQALDALDLLLGHDSLNFKDARENSNG